MCSFLFFGYPIETEGKLRLADVFVSITDSRQRKSRHDLVKVLVVPINEVLAWANGKLDWLRQYLKLTLYTTPCTVSSG
ncbi:hypothetical protein [Nitrosomonas eutropha]|uniref:hypothetical protein n=1 Tax=Nitrosomonas eutropha TaxID=916 RepID=UPI0008BFB606|nr:hypothetical protein [Nitrosomonas eutropha]SEI81837.1 hypothetical protein SAMN05216318_11228 [Nitrosomonas eutropha]